MSINLPPYDRCQPLQLLTAVYVLKLEGERVYIGQTRNLSNRLSEHWSRQGSTMTRTYKPSGVVELVFPANRDTEKQKTIEYDLPAIPLPPNVHLAQQFGVERCACLGVWRGRVKVQRRNGSRG